MMNFVTVEVTKTVCLGDDPTEVENAKRISTAFRLMQVRIENKNEKKDNSKTENQINDENAVQTAAQTNSKHGAKTGGTSVRAFPLLNCFMFRRFSVHFLIG